MRILLYKWEAYSERGLENALKEMGHTVRGYGRKIQNHLLDEEFLKELALLLVEEKMEAVVSFDFFPMISMACQAAKIKYISWIFGEPHYSLYSETVLYDGNYIFCFDSCQCEKVRKLGGKHIYHLPLAVDVPLFQEKLAVRNTKYQKDISFVGSLYMDERNYFAQISGLSEYVRGYIEGLCETQLKIFGYNILSDALADDIVSEIENCVSFHMDPGYSLTFRQFIIDAINKKITIMERSRTLSLLSEHYEVALYTKSDTTSLPKIHNCGYIDYYQDMPSVFHNSKININITLRSIFTGIPLRVLDVLGCGGFLITNYQEEIAEYFENGQELVMYSSMEELLELCSYYLKHEEERKRIAANGLQKVREEFNYRKQLSIIFDTVAEDR